MHESCVESALDGGDTAGPTTSAPGSRGEAGGSKSLAPAATPKEYVSFLRSWFDMHESKKVCIMYKILPPGLLRLRLGGYPKMWRGSGGGERKCVK